MTNTVRVWFNDLEMGRQEEITDMVIDRIREDEDLMEQFRGDAEDAETEDRASHNEWRARYPKVEPYTPSRTIESRVEGYVSKEAMRQLVSNWFCEAQF